MPDKKSQTLWRVNLISMGLFAVLALTGVINWLLPRGYETGGAGLGVSARHLLRFVHQWAAVLFSATILVHLGLHASYLRTMWKKRRSPR